jgi:DNA repair photolyase
MIDGERESRSDPGDGGRVVIREHPREVKTILRKRDLVDSYFVGKFAFSPYHACAHGCLYCDGRAERYFVEGEFDRDIVIRTNAPILLDKELARARERGIVFIGSGVSDAYQPSETKMGLMSECARVLAARSVPVTLLTKSTLVGRDIEAWKEVNRKGGMILMMSLTTLDEELRKTFEPSASPVEERLATLARFKAEGIAIGVAAMPFLPFLSDGAEAIRRLARRLADIGADFVLCSGLTLRPGRQKETYFEALRRSHPELVSRYDRLYGENRPSGAPLHAYMRENQRLAAAALEEARLPSVVPHRLYRNSLTRYDEVYVLLQQMLMLYSDHRTAAGRLRSAIDRYRAWIEERKRVFNRSRRMSGSDIEGELVTLADSRGLERLIENKKLAAFLREVIIDRREFDPLERKLIGTEG